MAILWALQEAPVTLSPEGPWAICTANEAHPHRRPQGINTFAVPPWSWPCSRRPCRAGQTGGRPRLPAASKEIVAGLERQASFGGHGRTRPKGAKKAAPHRERSPNTFVGRLKFGRTPCQWPSTVSGDNSTGPSVRNFGRPQAPEKISLITRNGLGPRHQIAQSPAWTEVARYP